MDAINLSASKKQMREKVETPPETDLTSLLDLQDFFSAELVNQGTAYRRAFIPLTEGLGLGSPRTMMPKLQYIERNDVLLNTHETPQLEAKHSDGAALFTERPPFESGMPTKILPPKPPVLKSENRLAEVIDSATATNKEPAFETEKEERFFGSANSITVTPPPLPRPALFKRLMAGTIDQVFVLLIWTALIVLTSNMINNFTTGFSLEILSDFNSPKFQRMATLEFIGAWLGYLGFSLLISKRTFGMWVWSMNVSYGDKIEENYFLRKAMRIFWTFIFSAPLIPTLVLIIHKNGRNILDVLSGTSVYDAN